MSTLLLPLLLALGGPARAEPVKIATGQQYTAGQRIGVAHLGLSFVIPQGWGGVGGAEVPVCEAPRVARLPSCAARRSR